MSRFNVCYRRVTSCRDPKPSHGFIAFHRCVESVARLTGLSYTDLFVNLERQFGFSRCPGKWPNAGQMHEAVEVLREIREAYLEEWRELLERRRAEKKMGYRHPREERLEEMESRRREQISQWPRIGCWGWAERRSAGGR